MIRPGNKDSRSAKEQQGRPATRGASPRHASGQDGVRAGDAARSGLAARQASHARPSDQGSRRVASGDASFERARSVAATAGSSARSGARTQVRSVESGVRAGSVARSSDERSGSAGHSSGVRPNSTARSSSAGTRARARAAGERMRATAGEVGQDASAYSRENAGKRLSGQRKAGAKRRETKYIVIGAVAFVAALVVVALVMCWNLWWRHDDAADIQGTWTLQGTDSQVTITDSSIYLTDTLHYEYTLDTSNKRITFTFEDKVGGGAYSFSDDRNTLTIAEADASDSNEEDPNIYTTLVRVTDSGDSSGEGSASDGSQSADSSSSDGSQSSSGDSSSSGSSQTASGDGSDSNSSQSAEGSDSSDS